MGGFNRVDSDDSYVLLGGGGHKLESSLSVAYAAASTNASYATSAGNADTVDGRHANSFVYWEGNASTDNMNDIARSFYSVTGMTLLASASVDNNDMSGWTHFFNTSYYDGGNGNNSWIFQLACPAGTSNLQFRSRDGGTITNGAAWTTPWTKIIHSGNIGSQSVNYATSAGSANSASTATSATYATSALETYDYQNGNGAYFSSAQRGVSGVTGALIYSYGANPISFYTNGSRKIQILSDGSLLQECNNSWLTPSRVQIGRLDSTAYSDRSCIGTTDGNLHIDSYPSHDIYLNYYSGNATVHIGSYTAIHSGNIGSQSVNYASSAGSVAWDNITGKPDVAIRASANNFIIAGDEFNFIPDNHNTRVRFNFQSPSRNSSALVTEYWFDNGRGGTIAKILSTGEYSGTISWANVTSKPSAVGSSSTPVYWTGSGFGACSLSASRIFNEAGGDSGVHRRVLASASVWGLTGCVFQIPKTPKSFVCYKFVIYSCLGDTTGTTVVYINCYIWGTSLAYERVTTFGASVGTYIHDGGDIVEICLQFGNRMWHVCTLSDIYVHGYQYDGSVDLSNVTWYDTGGSVPSGFYSI